MKKILMVDIGELGWSMYVSAHVNWLKKNTDDTVTVMTYPERYALHEEADILIPPPLSFFDKYDGYAQNCFGFYRVPTAELKSYFNLHAGDFEIPDYFNFNCNRSLLDKTIFKPYRDPSDHKKDTILVFPRYRSSERHSFRNLPSRFYEELVARLCAEHPSYRVVSLGTKNGAYNIINECSGYENKVGHTDVDVLLDECLRGAVAIGGTSAPPKIAMLQGVPTFIIGHEKTRFLIEENWLKTEVGFYEISEKGYEEIDIDQCLKDTISWVNQIIG